MEAARRSIRHQRGACLPLAEGALGFLAALDENLDLVAARGALGQAVTLRASPQGRDRSSLYLGLGLGGLAVAAGAYLVLKGEGSGSLEATLVKP